MLLILIILAWLSLIAIFWAICAMAARGDAESASRSRIAPTPRGGDGDGDGDRDGDDSESAMPESPPEPTVQDARRTSSGVR